MTHHHLPFSSHADDQAIRARAPLADLTALHPSLSAFGALVGNLEQINQAMSQLLSMADLLAAFTGDGNLQAISPSCGPQLGYEPGELIGTRYVTALDPEDRPLFLQTLQAVAGGQPAAAHQHRCIRKDGSVAWLEWQIVSVPQSGLLIGAARNITETKRLELELQRTQTLYQSLFAHNPDAIYSLDTDGRFTALNPACEWISGYTTEELLGKPFSILISPEHQEMTLYQFQRSLKGEHVTYETAIIHRSGRVVDLHITTIPVVVDGKTVMRYGLAKDVTERKQTEEQLSHLAFHDPLTGLANRALFMRRLEQALQESVRSQPSVGLLYLDLDDFKIVNDSLGHRAGDALLIEAGRRLQGCVRDADTVARLGGDEFTILLKGINDTDDAIAVADRILKTLHKPFVIDGHKVVVTPSLGVVMSNQGNDAKELLRYADIAMYQAKHRGKARYEAFTPAMYAAVLQRLQLETDLRRAIERNEFRLVYQPVNDLSTGGISGVEALLRWDHPEKGTISPAEFIPLAEETGLILPIDKWALREACRQAQAWQAEYPGLVVSVNLSARQFQEPFLADQVAKVLQETELDPRCLQLEITETILMQDAEMTQDTLRSLKDLGIQLAMDDFGTGYSSLSYLKRFPIDILKIDRSFVGGLCSNPEDNALVRTVILLAKALNLTVTGEGIETAEQMDQLRTMGCDKGQGFYFAMPLTHLAANQLLASERRRQSAV